MNGISPESRWARALASAPVYRAPTEREAAPYVAVRARVAQIPARRERIPARFRHASRSGAMRRPRITIEGAPSFWPERRCLRDQPIAAALDVYQYADNWRC